jgi:hypothetical protein
MKITAASAGRRENRTKVSMATFFLQDPKHDLEIHLKRWSKGLPGAILFKGAFDKLLLSNMDSNHHFHEDTLRRRKSINGSQSSM